VISSVPLSTNTLTVRLLATAAFIMMNRLVHPSGAPSLVRFQPTPSDYAKTWTITHPALS
jgi:hypothetical protein